MFEDYTEHMVIQNTVDIIDPVLASKERRNFLTAPKTVFWIIEHMHNETTSSYKE